MIGTPGWLELAKQGQLYAFGYLTEEKLNALYLTLRALSPETACTLYLDTEGGDNCSLPILEAILRLNCLTVVCGKAWSWGLMFAVCGEQRLAVPAATFLYHGERDRWHPELTARGANFMAERTTQGFDWWMEQADSQEELRFGTLQAVAWGVVEAAVPDWESLATGLAKT